VSWRSVFGLDAVEFVIFWAVSIVMGMVIGVMTNMPELAFTIFAFAGIVFAFLRRAALRKLPPQESGKVNELVAQLQDDQQASVDYFERKIAELEERVDFAERLLAKGEEHRQIER
jgi:membrane protein implicated in regulation of membrane protease activity